MTTFTATYSPDENKLRLYASSRLDSETYARVKAAGFKWAPKQDLFVAPMWTPGREDLLLELAGEIDDEDTSLVDRAEERADRFEDYSEKRLADAERAKDAVAAIADNIPFGQPILVGHHSEKHARRDAARIDSGMRKAVKMWETSGYWKARAAGAIRHAKYKELPAVRHRRIKGIEADKRKRERQKKETATLLKFWTNLEKIPESERHAVAVEIANRMDHGPVTLADGTEKFGAWGPLTDGTITAEEVRTQRLESLPKAIAYYDRWIAHYDNRLSYERAMLGESGGTVADRTGPEKGGACRCWASPGYGKGWSYIEKVNKVSVTVLDNYGNSGGNFTRTIPFDKLAAVMTAAEVATARAEGRIVEAQDGTGFFLGAPKPEEKAKTIEEVAPIVESEDASVAAESKPVTASAESKLTAEEAAHLYRTDPNAYFSAGLHIPETVPKFTVKPGPEGHGVEFSESVPPVVVVDSITPPCPPANDPYQVMRDTLRAGGVKTMHAAQLFPTPRALAARVIEEARLKPGDRILEPEAGTGRLIDAAIASDWEGGELVAVENNPALASALLAKYGGAVKIRHADFLECGDELGAFDVIVMNPPFADQADVRHVRHAARFLRPGGRLVALMAAGVTFRQDRMSTEFREFVESRLGTIEPLPADSFKESGTSVNAVLVTFGNE